MFSLRTHLKLVSIIEEFTVAQINRVLIAFNITIPLEKGVEVSRHKKGNELLKLLKNNGNDAGPFGGTIQKDLLQYIVDDFYQKNPIVQPTGNDFFNEEPVAPINIDDMFSEKFVQLSNLLKMDGYVVKHTTIRQLLPNELVAANVETELERLLRKFGFQVSEGHLIQAIDNHTQSNWAGANAQFRTFIESLLIDIANLLNPAAQVANCNNAITQLAIIVPCFLSTHLNEVKTTVNPNLNAPFVQGLINRLHPHGSHPGLSDEEDSTFRYHTVIVFAQYLLAMLEKRLP